VSAPFFAVDPRWWPDIADALPRPWSESAVLADLRWWEDQVWVKARKRIPGRRVLAARWGWPDRATRDILRGEEWRDQNVDKRVPLLSRSRPKSVPPVSRSRPASEPEPPESTGAPVPVVSQERPTSVPVVSQERPHARSTQHTSHSTHPKDNNYGERDGPNLSTQSDPLACFAAKLWRDHYLEIMGFPYKPPQRKFKQMLTFLREMAQVAGCDRQSTVDTVEGHRLNGAIKHYITAAKGRAIWPHKTGDAAPCPRTMRQHHLADCLAAAPRLRCRNCEGRGFRHGAYLVSTGDRVETHNFPCGACKPDALSTQRGELEAMGRVEGKTFWVQDVYPHEKHYGAYCALVQGTLAGLSA